ncbi:MAG: hypothetical protein LBB05_00710 [Puniceicoccales bacterium]|jgi:hypothetical protein|nr:hypothetical protein [Puniceicoccales bacterium]
MGGERLLSDVSKGNVFTGVIFANKANKSVNLKIKVEQSETLSILGDRDRNFPDKKLTALKIEPRRECSPENFGPEMRRV